MLFNDVIGTDFMYRVVLHCVILFAVLVNPVFASDSLTVYDEEETSQFTFGFDKDFTSRYVDRGMSYNRGMVSQSTIWLTLDDFTFSVWGNYVVYDLDDNIKNHEVDFTVVWSKSIDNFYIEPSVYYCVFPDQPDYPSTAESNLFISYTRSMITVYSNLRVDILEYRGSVSGDLGITSSFNLYHDIQLCGDINSGWTNGKFNVVNYGIDEHLAKFQYLNFGLSLIYSPVDFLNLVPHFEYIKPFTGTLMLLSGSGLSNFGLRFEIAY